MKQKTFYISDDGLYFTNLNDCYDYEHEFYIRIKKSEENHLGERIKHVMFEPCLETKQHNTVGILDLVTTLCVCLSSRLKDCDENKHIYHKIADIHRFVDEIYNDENCDIAKNWTYIRNLLNICRKSTLKYDSIDKQGDLYTKQTIFNTVANRIYNTSIVTGIEYPEYYYVNNEDKWNNFVKETKAYIEAGGKYR